MAKPVDETALLRRADLRDEVRLFAKRIIVHEMKAQKLTYRALADRLAPYGIRETAAVLNTRIYRGTFSAAFLLTCMKALGITRIDLTALDPTEGGRETRRQRELYEEKTRQHYRQMAAKEKHARKAARERRARRRASMRT